MSREWHQPYAAPLATLGGNVHCDYREVAYKVAIAFVVFCLAASSTYVISDVRDVHADRQHPTKRFRPIAAGVVAPALAYALAIALRAASLAISLVTAPPLAVVIAVYLVIQLGYNLVLTGTRLVVQSLCGLGLMGPVHCRPNPVACEIN